MGNEWYNNYPLDALKAAKEIVSVDDPNVRMWMLNNITRTQRHGVEQQVEVLFRERMSKEGGYAGR